jgi:hypothetical protein
MCTIGSLVSYKVLAHATGMRNSHSQQTFVSRQLIVADGTPSRMSSHPCDRMHIHLAVREYLRSHLTLHFFSHDTS